MREILFRGKTLSTHEWVQGGYFSMNNRTFIVTEHDKDYRMYEVDPNSVGQYIGQVDRVGDRIFEGDIVYVAAEDEYARIYYSEDTGRFNIEFDCWVSSFDHFYGHELEVSCNTFDEGWYSNG